MKNPVFRRWVPLGLVLAPKTLEFSSPMLQIKDAPHRDEHFDIKNVDF
jgi:hypothetical protein